MNLSVCALFFAVMLLRAKGKECLKENILIKTVLHGNPPDIAFNVTMKEAVERKVCLQHVADAGCNTGYQQEYCPSFKPSYSVLLEHSGTETKARPRLGCPYILIIHTNDNRGLECTFTSDRKATNGNVTRIRNDTAYPAPLIKLKPTKGGINFYWNLTLSENDNLENLSLRITIDNKWIEDVKVSSKTGEKTLNLNSTKGNLTSFLFDQHHRQGKKSVLPLPEMNTFESSEESNNVMAYLSWAFIAVLLFVVKGAFCWWNRCKNLPDSRQVVEEIGNGLSRWTEHENPLYFEKPKEQTSIEPWPDVNPNELQHIKRIGEGNYGQVELMKWKSCNFRLVAVKTFKNMEDTDKNVLQSANEIDIFTKVGTHANIVQMLGYNRNAQPRFIIMEYVELGDLANYLQKLRVDYEKAKNLKCIEDKKNNYITSDEIESQPLGSVTTQHVLKTKDLESFGKQIAEGMAHLEKCGVIHRDLAARNILLTRDKTVKITDFGLSREGPYVNTSQLELPVRWMAPETYIEKDLFWCSKSDVWSFGIVLWEIGTLGGHPYASLAPKQLMVKLQQGERLQKPETVNDNLYKLMQQCWQYNYNDRPSFQEILQTFNSMAAYFELSNLKSDYEFPPIYYNNSIQS